MAVSEMHKIQLLVLQKDEKTIFGSLQQSGLVQFVEDTETETEIQETAYNIAQIDFALKLILGQLPDVDKLPLLEKLRGGKISITQKKAYDVELKFNSISITNELAELEAQLNEAKSIIEKNRDDILTLDPWKKLNVSQNDIINTENVVLQIGSIEYHEDNIPEKVFIHIINAENQPNLVLVAFHKNNELEIRKWMTEQNFTEATLPHGEKKPTDAIEQLQSENKKYEQVILDVEKKIRSYSKHYKNLKISRDVLTWNKEQLEAREHTTQTSHTIGIQLWINEDDRKDFEKIISTITHEYEIIDLPISEDDEVPVQLRNNSAFSPFESVTGLYGMPLKSEPDPTPFLTPFFVVYFGLALTDAAYGIILALGAFLAIKILRIPKNKSKLFVVMIWGGLSTFVFGALFGGWFGIILANFNGPIGSILQNIQIIDSLGNPITVLIFTMILGVIQVMVGISIKGYWDFKQGKVKDAIFDSGFWLAFIAAILLWVCAKVGVLPETMLQPSLYLLGITVIALILTQGRTQKNPIAKLLSGLLSLYGLVGYFSDVLSYSRLLALGLSTAIIASVINLVAFLFKDMIPWSPVGWAVAIVILIGGHLFNMVINILGAYIHSGRLQFVEFFPKFMEGGGQRFEPFSQNNKYIELQETAELATD